MKLRGRVSSFGGVSDAGGRLLALLLVCGWCISSAAPGNEPSPPDVLDVVVVPNASANAAGTVTIETVVKQTLDATAELEIDDPAGSSRLKSGERTKRFALRKGGAQSREQVQVNVQDKKPRTVRVRLRLLGTDGQPWMIVEREVKLNQPATETPAARQRVPVVRTLPDGTRMVEYLTSQEAVARGLPAEGKPAPPSPLPPTDEKQEK